MACITDEMKAAIQRFEKSVRAEHYSSGLPSQDPVRLKIVAEYEAAKAELTEYLSWVP